MLINSVKCFGERFDVGVSDSGLKEAINTPLNDGRETAKFFLNFLCFLHKNIENAVFGALLQEGQSLLRGKS